VFEFLQNKSTKRLVSFHLSNSNFQISFCEGIALKMLIKKHAALGLMQNLKVATKLNSSVSFDRQTLAKVETSIKNKLKVALSGDVNIPGTRKSINVEFYGAGGFKYKLKDETFKPVFEVGLTLTVPFDLF
jgi:hypothetical protein